MAERRGWFNRANALDVFTSLIERGAAWWFALSTILAGSALSGLAAYYSELRRIHIAAAVIVTGVCISVMFLLIGIARNWYYRAQVMARLASDGDVINPLAETFERKRIKISNFYTPYRYIYRNRTFIDC